MEWLHLLGLGDYLDTLCGQGYNSIDYVTDITWEDLEDIGIRKLGKFLCLPELVSHSDDVNGLSTH